MLPVRPLKIGSLQLATNLLLAPIAGYCDLAFRLVARSCGGVGLACTDLLCPQGVLKENKRSMELAMTCPEDSPLAMQLYGADVDLLCEAARWAEDRGAHLVDINMGCPVDKVTKKNGGSKLLCDPDSTLHMVEKVKASLRNVPLTCKLRLGWDDTCIVAPSMARRLEEAGVSAVTIHGRTTEMKFSGNARLDGIAEVVASCKTISYTKCAGVMIGRGALSKPWIFRDVWSYLTTGEVPPPPTVEEIVQMMRDHFYGMIQFRHERAAVLEFRKRISWYAKNLHPCKRMREEVRLMNSPAEFEEILKRFLDWRCGLAADEEQGRRGTLHESSPVLEEV